MSPAGNHCQFVLLDDDGSCPTADRSNPDRSNGQVYETGELLDTTLVEASFLSPLAVRLNSISIFCVVIHFMNAEHCCVTFVHELSCSMLACYV